MFIIIIIKTTTSNSRYKINNISIGWKYTEQSQVLKKKKELEILEGFYLSALFATFLFVLYSVLD